MSWHRRYLVRSYLSNSLWVPCVLGLLAGLAGPHLVGLVDRGRELNSSLAPDAARNVLGTLASAIFTCIIFASSTLLLAMQLASAQLTPRLIALVFKDPVTKLSLTLFAFAFTFTLAVLIRIGEVVPMFAARMAAYSCLASLGLFLVMVDHVGRFLRPSGALRVVAQTGHRVIGDVFPRGLGAPTRAPEPQTSLNGQPTSTVTSRSSGVVLALDIAGLVSIARQFDCTIVLLPQVGDFVAMGEPLFRVVGGRETLPSDTLRHSVAVGQERTFEQDPALAFRAIVDVACKALSPAINDPTTAVLAIDQIHHLLRDVGNRRLDEGQVRDAAGRLRLVHRTPDWEDFVRLAVTEIRQFGRGSVQVARRLRSMLENLIQELPQERSVLLHRELELLHRTVAQAFPEPEDQALADAGDSQGVGGKSEDE